MNNRLSHFIVYGPVNSRRLGRSLGINILPYKAKICTFDCVYCECGFNDDKKGYIPTRIDVRTALEGKLVELKENGDNLDVITFSGNGEPTLHKEFEGIIQDTIHLRNQYFPQTKLAVLSNATNLDRASVVNTLKKVDNNILKLDSAIHATILKIDQPTQASFNIPHLVEQMKQFQDNLIIQTMFVRGTYKGQNFDNTTKEEIDAWLNVIKEVHPKQVMIYALNRPAPIHTIEKVSIEELEAIAKRVKSAGYHIIVAG